MKHQKLLSACIGALALLCGIAAFRGGASGRATLEPAGTLRHGNVQPRASRGAERATVAGDARDALAASSEGATGAAPCPDSVLPAFWHYVARARATPPEQRADFVARPARSIETLPEKERRALGVLGLAGFELTFPYGPRTLEADLAGSLMERWIECARDAGRAVELRDATLAFLSQEARFGLAAADQALIGLAASFVGHFTDDDEGLRVAFDALMPLVEAALDEPGTEWESVRPLLGAIAQASRHSHGRQRLLALLNSPVLQQGHCAFSFLAYVTAGQAFRDWRDEVELYLHAPEPTLCWGAVEALRGFAARGTRRPELGLSPDELMEVLPPELFRHQDRLVRLAAIELAVAYGGDPGRDALLALLSDPDSPRAEVLHLLAMAPGKLDPEFCIALLGSDDRELGLAAIAALSQLARRGEASYLPLRALAIDSEDPELRRRAVSALGMVELDEALQDLELAARDVDDAVQLEAVRQLGLWATPQPELLERVATDVTRADDVRQRAFQEWLHAATDEALPEVFDAMYRDPSPETRAQGYLWKAAIAMASGDQAALAAWEELPVPAHLIEAASDNALERAAARALPGTARAVIRSRIRDEAKQLLNAERRRNLEGFEAGLALIETETRTTRSLRRGVEVPLRIIRYLEAHSAAEQ